MSRLARLLTVLAALAGGGCALAPGLYMNESSGQIVSTVARDETDRLTLRLVPITPAVTVARPLRPSGAVAEPAQIEQAYEYLVGAQDVLSVIVWEHPELTIPAGEVRAADAVGHRVSNDGTIYYPYVGTVAVAGKPVEEIREALRQSLARYIPSPQLDVRVAAFRSQKVYVTGEVATPGNVPITDVPLHLVDAINAAGGTRPTADLAHVSLVRGEQRLVLDLLDIYDRGNLAQNLLLRDGDVVNVPDKSSQKVFVLGEVRNQTAVIPERGRLTLADALTGAGGLNQETSDGRRIFVLRDEPAAPTVYHLDAGAPEALILAARFELRPSDVVFVSSADVARVERVMRAVLPVARTFDSVDAIVHDRRW